MSKPSIYLAGPITGLGWDASTDWRNYVKEQLSPEIDCFSPLRGKEYLSNEKELKDQYFYHVMSTQRGILARDHYDATKRDLLFANMLDAKRVSIGTVMEIAWAYEARVPIVLIMEKEGNLHDHSMIREACPLTVHAIEDAILLTRQILLPDVPVKKQPSATIRVKIMPYIDKDSRPKIDEWVDAGVYNGINFSDPGVLNYVLTKILLETEPKRYKDFNELVGVLECCKLEFYRRAVAPYEGKKIVENGDVYNGY